MNNQNDLPFKGVLTPEIGALKQHWGWLLALGVMFLILGFIGLGRRYF